MLAAVCDRLDGVYMAVLTAARMKPTAPKPYPRPGVSQEAAPKGDPTVIAFLERQRVEHQKRREAELGDAADAPYLDQPPSE